MKIVTLLCVCLAFSSLFFIHCENEVEDAIADLGQLEAPLEASTENCGCAHQSPVAFKAHLSHTITPAADQIIVFDDVQLNLGNAYRPDNGIFVAPQAGLYMFSLSVCSDGPHYIVVDIVKNGNRFGRVLAGDVEYDDCSSETSIVQLAVGDQVYLKHHGIYGDVLLFLDAYPNSLSGVLLQPM